MASVLNTITLLLFLQQVAVEQMFEQSTDEPKFQGWNVTILTLG